MSKRSVFLSFHHEDISRKRQLEKILESDGNRVISKSVRDGDIPDGVSNERLTQIIREKHLRNSTVTIVLIGCETWTRKHVDWEIYGSLRETKTNSRSGLIGILLPEFLAAYGVVNSTKMPPRLVDNLSSGFASIHKWNESPQQILQWVNEAHERRNTNRVDNTRVRFAKNRKTDSWI